MPRFFWYLIAAVLLTAGSAFAACNGDDNGNGAPTAVDGNGNGDDNGDDNGNGGGGGDSDLERAAERFLNSTFRATYAVSGALFGELENTTFAMYKDGNERFRFDISGEEDGERSTIIVIQTGDVSAFCVEGGGELGGLFGAEDAEGVCFSDDGINPFDDFAEELRTFSSDYEVLSTDSRTIAGQDADCFEVREIETGNEQEFCFSGEGGLLYFEDRAENSSFEATEYSSSVSGGDFELPYPIQEIPSP